MTSLWVQTYRFRVRLNPKYLIDDSQRIIDEYAIELIELQEKF